MIRIQKRAVAPTRDSSVIYCVFIRRVLRGVPDIAQVRFGEEDVVRHDLVAAIIHAYEEDGKRRKHREEADHGDHD